MSVSRRDFMQHYVAPVCIAASFRHLFSSSLLLADSKNQRVLLPEPLGILALAEGFRLQVVQKSGDIMTDGYHVPGSPDGMGVFPGAEGTCILMRNHELTPENWHKAAYPRGAAPSLAYDLDSPGGVTRLVWDIKQERLLSSNLSLTGTKQNCAGGWSPWGWMSCEEIVEKDHGFVFCVDPHQQSLGSPRLIRAYGRFKHEACFVDPRTFIAFMTEDQYDSCFYRFVPHNKAEPFQGQLQALRVLDAKVDISREAKVGDSWAVEWLDVPDSAFDDDGMRTIMQDLGATRFIRGEGLCCWNEDVFFTCTEGGPVQLGQVFKYDQAAQTLTLVGQSTDKNQLNMADNITITPWGDLYMAEDGKGHCHLRLLTPQGWIYTLARNIMSTGEFSGVCFSPDYSTLFCNLQNDGLTLAIQGPFKEFALLEA